MAVCLGAAIITTLTGAALTIASAHQYPAATVALIMVFAILVTILNVCLLGLFGFWAELRRALDNRRRPTSPPDIEFFPLPHRRRNRTMNPRSDRDLIATQLDDLDAAWDTFIGVQARDPGHDQLAPIRLGPHALDTPSIGLGVRSPVRTPRSLAVPCRCPSAAVTKVFMA